MPTPSYNQYLAQDTTYQGQIAQLRKAYIDYVASQNNDKTNYNAKYALDSRDVRKAKGVALTDQTDDFASRGMVRSGLYGKAVADTTSDYSRKQTGLNLDRTSRMNDLATNLNNFRGDQQTTRLSARQEALARRAAKYTL